jgi:protease-4
MTESLNTDMYEQLVRGIARRSQEDGDRGPPAARIRGRLRRRTRCAPGLVDALAYEDQLDDRVPQLRQGGDMRRVEGSELSSGDAPIARRPAAVQNRASSTVSGVIASGKSGYDPGNGAVVGSDTFVEQLRRLRNDDAIKAIVLASTAPGGSSVASDVMWRELMITRDEKPSRPLVVSMSDLAASGGYYISVPGQVIVAQPGTLTGSIGIFAGQVRHRRHAQQGRRA